MFLDRLFGRPGLLGGSQCRQLCRDGGFRGGPARCLLGSSFGGLTLCSLGSLTLCSLCSFTLCSLGSFTLRSFGSFTLCGLGSLTLCGLGSLTLCGLRSFTLCGLGSFTLCGFGSFTLGRIAAGGFQLDLIGQAMRASRLGLGLAFVGADEGGQRIIGLRCFRFLCFRDRELGLLGCIFFYRRCELGFFNLEPALDQLKISRFIRRVTGLDEFVNGQQLGFQLLIGDFGRVNGRLFESLFFNRRSIQIRQRAGIRRFQDDRLRQVAGVDFFGRLRFGFHHFLGRLLGGQHAVVHRLRNAIALDELVLVVEVHRDRRALRLRQRVALGHEARTEVGERG